MAIDRMGFLRGLVFGSAAMVVGNTANAKNNKSEKIKELNALKDWVEKRKKESLKKEFEQEQYWLYHDYKTSKSNDITASINFINNLFTEKYKRKNCLSIKKHILKLKNYYSWYKNEYDKKIVPVFFKYKERSWFDDDLTITKYDTAEAIYRGYIMIGSLQSAEKWFETFEKDFNKFLNAREIHYSVFADSLFLIGFHKESIKFYKKDGCNSRWFNKWMKTGKLNKELVEAQRRGCKSLLFHSDFEKAELSDYWISMDNNFSESIKNRILNGDDLKPKISRNGTKISITI
jgi:hypothetical protein